MAKLKAGWIEVRQLDGAYRALLRYRDPLSGRKLLYGEPLYADSEADAHTAAAELQPQLAQYLATRKQAKRDPEQMALADWVLIDWAREYQGKLPPSTRSRMEQWWRKWLQPLAGGATLSELTPAFVEGLAEHMQEQGAAWPTVEAAVKDLRMYLRDAAKAGLVPTGQLDELRLSPPELSPDELAELGEPEFAVELEHAVRIAWSMNGLDDVALGELMCVAGLRLGEARALTVSSVLHDDGRARARVSVRLGVSGRGRQRQFRGTKKTRGLSLRAVQAGFRSPHLVPNLGRLLERLWQQRANPPLRERLAPGTHGAHLGVKNEANWRRREFAQALERSDVQEIYPNKKITPKEFRAVAAAAYGNAQVPELSARDQLGHSADSTTLRFYFSTYEDPNPELRGLSVDAQLARARRITLAWMDGRLAEIVAAREGIGKNRLLNWRKDGTDQLAESVNESSYRIGRDGSRYALRLEERNGDGEIVRSKLLASGLTVAQAKEKAEPHALKRTRQSLTIQRQRMESLLPHLRALVAAAETASPAAA